MRRPPSLLQGIEALRALTEPSVLLDRDLVIRGANPAYLRATERTEDELYSINLFEAFPDNPELGGTGSARLAASFERVLRHDRVDHMTVLRYDLLDAGQPPTYQQRHWVPVSSPVHDGDDVVGILVRVHDVTRLHPSALAVLTARSEASGPRSDAEEDRTVESLLIAAHDLEAMAREIEQLREALSSRAVIDQAKGIVMARTGVTADEAFRSLVKMSNDTNVRVAEVAAALVYSVSGTTGG